MGYSLESAAADVGTRTELEARQYLALKRAGHSPAKAAEIVLDAKRGDSQALGWIRAIMG